MTTDSAIHKYSTVTVEAVGRAYRAAHLSIRAIAEKYEVSQSTVRAWAKANDWKRDRGLKADIRREAERRSMVAEGVKNVPDAELVDQFSDEGARVLRAHRKELGALRGMVEKLVRDWHGLEAMTEHDIQAAELRYLADLEAAEKVKKSPIPLSERKARLAQGVADRILKIRCKCAYFRTAIFRDLTVAFTRLVTVERTAYGLDDDGDVGDFESALKELHDGHDGKDDGAGHTIQ